MTKVWLHFFIQSNNQFSDTVTRLLEHAGLNPSQLSPKSTPSGPGIIFFDKITHHLCNLLREFSRNGLEQVLAIAISHSILAGNASWELLKAGASDVFSWDHSANTAVEVTAKIHRWDNVNRLINSPQVKNSLIGQSLTWMSVLRQIVEVVYFTDASVLIMGESGTGKELIARLIHALDQRPNKHELTVLDCTTIMPELSGSEFFGHERGAFTGAVDARNGAFALANNGTLFLDEVGELPLRLQAQLLRVIQERTYKRVGGNTWHNTEFRLVCATNRNLLQSVENGEFRHDLYHRIANWICKLPPLRERTEDILPLARHFIQQLRPNEEPPELEEPVSEYLLKRDYPGNVRDLKQLVSRIMYRYAGTGPITIGNIPEEERHWAKLGQIDWRDKAFDDNIRRALSMGLGLKEIGRIAEDTAEGIVLYEEDGNLQRAASKLGITDRALQMRRAARRQNEQELHQDN